MQITSSFIAAAKISLSSSLFGVFSCVSHRHLKPCMSKTECVFSFPSQHPPAKPLPLVLSCTCVLKAGVCEPPPVLHPLFNPRASLVILKLKLLEMIHLSPAPLPQSRQPTIMSRSECCSSQLPNRFAWVYLPL